MTIRVSWGKEDWIEKKLERKKLILQHLPCAMETEQQRNVKKKVFFIVLTPFLNCSIRAIEKQKARICHAFGALRRSSLSGTLLQTDLTFSSIIFRFLIELKRKFQSQSQSKSNC